MFLPSFASAFPVQSKYLPPGGKRGQTWTTEPQICSTHTAPPISFCMFLCFYTNFYFIFLHVRDVCARGSSELQCKFKAWCQFHLLCFCLIVLVCPFASKKHGFLYSFYISASTCMHALPPATHTHSTPPHPKCHESSLRRVSLLWPVDRGGPSQKYAHH